MGRRAGGKAKLLIEGAAAARELRPEDWIDIPAVIPHRVV